MRGEAVERPLQLTHAAAGHARQLLEDAVGERHLAFRALVAQNRDAGFVLRQTDVDDEATGEPRDQALIDVGDLRRRAVARHDDLATTALQRVEDAQHLALRLAPAGEELDVIDQEQIHALVALLERFGLSRRDREVQLIDEIVERYVLHDEIRLQLLGRKADGADQVRLA